MKLKLFTLPNIVTLGNLALGMIALWVLAENPSVEALATAFWLMVGAAVCDFADGFVARLTKQTSAIGVQLDSLSDMVSFGVLPTMIAVRIYEFAGGEFWWAKLIIGTIVLASALRLAKFNVDDSQKSEFRGLPTPACGLLIGSVGYWCAQNLYVTGQWEQWAVVGSAVLSAWLLISPIKMVALKFKGVSWRENKWRYIILALGAISIACFGVIGVAMAIGIYFVVSVVKVVKS